VNQPFLVSKDAFVPVKFCVQQNVGIMDIAMMILTIKDNKMHSFSDLFDKALYMFQTGPLSVIRSISKL
jgi:hypothetical protein